MANLTYNYVYFASGPHTRQPRSSSGPGGFTLIQTYSGGTLSAGDTFVAGLPPATVKVGNDTYGFAFESISGGTGGGVTSTSSSTPPPAVTVGSSDIVVLVVYGPPSGPGPGNGPSGTTIDSFDITTGALFSDTFVTVTPDPTGTLTSSGNKEGWVASATGPLTIKAVSPTSPTGVDFQYWLNVGTDATSTSANLAVGQNQTLSALAFYQAPLGPSKASCQNSLNYLQQIIDDGDKPKLPWSQWTLLVKELNACVAAGNLSAAEVETAINNYLAVNREPPPPKHPGSTLS